MNVVNRCWRWSKKYLWNRRPYLGRYSDHESFDRAYRRTQMSEQEREVQDAYRRWSRDPLLGVAAIVALGLIVWLVL